MASAQVYNSMIIATSTQNAISACIVMNKEDVSQRRNLEKDVLSMKLVEERECAFSLPLSRLMVFALK